MAKITVGTEAVRLPSYGPATPIIQNLGPGTVYIGDTEDVTADDGFELAVDAHIKLSVGSSSAGPIWLISDAADTDVRVVTLG